jgi:hypothetical protein
MGALFMGAVLMAVALIAVILMGAVLMTEVLMAAVLMAAVLMVVDLAVVPGLELMDMPLRLGGALAATAVNGPLAGPSGAREEGKKRRDPPSEKCQAPSGEPWEKEKRE